MTLGFGELENLTTNHKLDQWALLFCLFFSHILKPLYQPPTDLFLSLWENIEARRPFSSHWTWKNFAPNWNLWKPEKRFRSPTSILANYIQLEILFIKLNYFYTECTISSGCANTYYVYRKKIQSRHMCKISTQRLVKRSQPQNSDCMQNTLQQSMATNLRLNPEATVPFQIQ